MAFDQHSKRRIERVVRDVERRNRTHTPRDGKRRALNTLLITVKPTVQINPGDPPASCEIWDEDGATGVFEDCEWAWETDGKSIAVDAECTASRMRQWENWQIVSVACSGLIDPPGAPLGDPPTASGSQDTGTPGELGLDATSTAASGLSITGHQWTLSLPSNETLIISGPDGSAPNFVYDSRGTWDLTDVGGDIAGNIEALTLDETGGGLSGPYTVSLTSTQTDGQSDTEAIT